MIDICFVLTFQTERLTSPKPSLLTFWVGVWISFLKKFDCGSFHIDLRFPNIPYDVRLPKNFNIKIFGKRYVIAFRDIYLLS